MAPPLLQLSDISLTFGGDALLDQVSLVIQPGERLALVGRNGSGKSTLMKLMAGLVEPDSGTVVAATGSSVAYLEQEPDFSSHDTLGDYVTAALGPENQYKAERAAEGLKLNLAQKASAASGGEKRRVALARVLAEEPDLMLLDEPTNHLDLAAILWLEEYLKASRSAFVVISHDRAFLRNLTRGTLWLDRGELRRNDRGFEAFEDWREKTWAEEDLARHKLNRKIKAEARWAVEGISARRKRNQGRVRALQALREERAGQIQRKGTADLQLSSGQQSGKRVIEAKGLSKSYEGRVILRDFSIDIARGDRIAIIGPNGAGKTTLVNLLTGKERPDSGHVKLGTNIDMAMLDQRRDALMPDLSLWENLTGDPDMRVSGKADQVMVRGTPRHVVGYLKDFLFDEAQARAPVRSLSGGEKARLLMARIMARPSNLLVLDEPTNDLDVETLDLLQDVLGDYDGTVIIVSHDRDFIDRIATMTIAMEGDGRAVVYAGGYSDYRKQMGAPSLEKPKSTKPSDKNKDTKSHNKAISSGLTFTQKHKLEALPAQIERLEAEIEKLTEFLAQPELFHTAPAKFAKASEALVERQAALSAAEEEWLQLEELNSES